MGLAGFAHESVVSWWVSLAWLFLRGLTHLAIGWLLTGALGVTAWGLFHPLVGTIGPHCYKCSTQKKEKFHT